MSHKNFLNSLLAIVLISCCSQTHASNEKDAQRFLDWAQAKFLDLLNPPSAELNRALGYAYRHFKSSGVYLALYGDQVYGIGGPLGDKLVTGGDVANFIVKTVNDQTDKTLSLRQAECSNYVSKNVAAVTDLYSKEILASNLNISLSGEECVFISNSLPNHDFGNSTRSFAHPAMAVPTEYRITTKPKFASQATPISLTTDNAIFLNGVKLDLLAAGCFGIGDGKIGCNDMNQKWRYDPMSPSANFGTDAHNAHTQPDSTYHYHAGPSTLFPEYPTKDSPVIGFAADGFPIFGSYFTDDSGALRAAKGSYQLKNGMRPSGPDNPDGQYDGTFIDDYEFIADSGDLDECNGMMRRGVYGYYVTDSYPWVLGCFKGTPNLSFNKRGRKEVSLPKIEIVNYTEFDTERFLKLGMTVIQKARRRIRDLSIWIWPVGRQIKEGFGEGTDFNLPFNTHELVLTSSQIAKLNEQMASWINRSCGTDDSNQYQAELTRVKYIVEEGGDASTMVVPCYQSGMGLIADIQVNQDRREQVDHILAHEVYHGIQQDLELASCRDRRQQLEESKQPNNHFWIMEGTADYAAKIAIGELFGSEHLYGGKYENRKSILGEAYENYMLGDTEMSTVQGAAALALMVERGDLDERIILDASMWWNCKVLDDYSDDNAAVVWAKNNWFKIQKTEGPIPTYQFTSEALAK